MFTCFNTYMPELPVVLKTSWLFWEYLCDHVFFQENGKVKSEPKHQIPFKYFLNRCLLDKSFFSKYHQGHTYLHIVIHSAWYHTCRQQLFGGSPGMYGLRHWSPQASLTDTCWLAGCLVGMAASMVTVEETQH